MSTLVKMPQLGETVVEGTVARWLKAPGDPVAKLEPLLEITTDKIDTEVPAPADGVLLTILVAEGQTVRAGTALAQIGNADEKVGESANGGQATDHEIRITNYESHNNERPTSGTPHPPRPTGRDFISPVVGRIVREHGIALDQVTGTGIQGRITKKDVLAFIERQKIETGERSIETREQRLETIEPVSSPQSSALDLQSADEILHPLTAIRRAIAQHMVQSKQTSPHVTTIFEVDMTAVVQHREAHKTDFANRGVKLTFTPYFVAAAVVGLRATPRLNGRFTERGIVVNRRIHIGVAVALADGLIVPVIRNADEHNLQGLARELNELAERARAGKLGPDDVRGGTFTITNHGVGGSLVGSPIINQPQAGILGIGAIVKRPVVRSTQSELGRSSSHSLLPSADDAIVIRPMCYLSLSFDHRILDGAEADRFLMVVKATLENWRD
jgi:2-oxoisovalerate dehydrogenase E2 component (dihydrolipoyl transacylase)